MNNIRKHDWNAIGQRVNFERKRVNLSLAELGDIIGITRQTISDWEKGKGKEISLNVLLKMCDVFQCDLEYLICEIPCRERTITDIQKETGLSEIAIKVLISTYASIKCVPTQPIPGIISAINKMLEEYDSSTNKEDTSISAIDELLSIPQFDTTVYSAIVNIQFINRNIENISHNKNAFIKSIDMLETARMKKVQECLIRLSRGEDNK